MLFATSTPLVGLLFKKSPPYTFSHLFIQCSLLSLADAIPKQPMRPRGVSGIPPPQSQKKIVKKGSRWCETIVPVLPPKYAQALPIQQQRKRYIRKSGISDSYKSSPPKWGSTG
ncbi:hypothetical protein GGI35DRAFT_414285 [Trichoderma velutinum]